MYVICCCIEKLEELTFSKVVGVVGAVCYRCMMINGYVYRCFVQ